MKFTAIALTVCFAFTSVAEAYIPHSRTIIGRLARNQGKGAYAIEQEIEFKQGTETTKVRERWIVDDAAAMRLSVSGPGAKFVGVYRAKNRVVPDLKGGWSNGVPGAEFVEPFAYARSTSEILRLLNHSGIVPGSFSRERPQFNPNSKTPYTPEPLVRLGRVEGVVTYVFGTPSPADQSKPGAWIEQDSFLLRKLRFPSNAEVVASHFGSFDSGLKLPKERKITWGDRTATIHVISVKSIPSAQAQKLLSSTTLTPNDAREAQLPEIAKEFYSRFR